ncbi:MAG: hypothetical protein QGH24_02850 [Candidatus Marinimicrobia bacterium]|nr:hypothetical protein [Candidatus Neomarinimicrobiota bacterium]|tara:strand:- start:329 stop:829 length:501 start_codon:yes stop_codon:yes gene_type:complete
MDPDGTVSDIGAKYFSQDNSYSMDILDGWNMVGISVEIENSFYQDIFENTIDNSLFFFNEDGVYELVENLQLGIGYWLRFGTPYQANISGTIINSLTINLTEGWNLISGISFSLDVEEIEDPENLIIPGTIFKFDGNYSSTESIFPGFGYWVRSNGSGQIIMNYFE